MQVSREYLLDLDNKRTKIEEEIEKLHDYLTADGMPGNKTNTLHNIIKYYILIYFFRCKWKSS